ncbi:uncharacterized protein LOC135129375 [Zophobas morio]|uniref:Hansolin n=1 Tax=Zophobas atratus TaxID=7074 RepID=A0A977SQ48_ZOPAT|nr:hansolin [Zophobas atratus]
MWRIIMTSLLYVVMVESRPMDPLDGPLWPQDVSISTLDLFPRRNPDVRLRSFHQNMYNPDTDFDLLVPQFPANKRAITMFSRWSPISSFGKGKTPTRSNMLPHQIKDRHPGQPLRWG